MKRALAIAFLLLAQGCDLPQRIGGASSISCPTEPSETLGPDDIEQVTLNQGPVEVTGVVGQGHPRGYAFEGQPGQQLSYDPGNNICVWVYAPNSNLVSDLTLQLEGKYILHVATPNSSTDYALRMGFGGSSEVGTSSAPSNPPEGPTNVVNSTQSPAPSQGVASDLSQSQARALIQKWLDTKAEIFAPPYNRRLAAQVTTGTLYNDIAQRGGSIEWLESNSSRYIYSESEIKDVWEFDGNGDRPSLKVSIYEDRVLLKKNGRRDPAQSGASTDTFTYYFTKENGTWKIDDYKENN